jgi:hypothetical protein
LDRKPSIEEKPHLLAGSHDSGSGEDSDALLDLLCDDEGEEDEEGEDDLLLPTSQKNSQEKPVGSNTFDGKLERLKRELMSNDTGGSECQNEAEFGSNRTEPMYENFERSRSDPMYGNTGESEGEVVMSHAPAFDGHRGGEEESKKEPFDLDENQSYGSLSKVPPTADTGAGGGRLNVYEDADAVVRYLEQEQQREEAAKKGVGFNGTGGAGDDGGPHEYVDMDSVFADSAGETGHYYDVPDGGLLSRQALPPHTEPEQLELDEILPFNNLPPLVCTARLGDEVAMRKLADTAASVLSEVVKSIHTSLGKLTR